MLRSYGYVVKGGRAYDLAMLFDNMELYEVVLVRT